VAAAVIGIPAFAAVNIRIPEGAFRLIVPEIIEIIPSRFVGKEKSEPDGFPLIQNVLHVGDSLGLRNACRVYRGFRYGFNGIAGGCRNIFAGHFG